MAKKKSDKEKDTESKVPSTNKFTAFFKNESIILSSGWYW